MEGIYERGKKSTAQIRKIQVLQGLRGIAFLLIFISHCNYRLNSYGRNIFTWLGGLGVSIFIMLSGYLLMENHHSDSLNAIEYLKKKLKKVYPLHILTLIMALPLTIGGLKTIKYWIALFQNLALVQSWSTDWEIYFSFNAVAWYLSIYVFFILISPLVIRVLNGMEPYFFLLVGGIIGFEFVWCFFVQNKSIAHWLIYICPIVRSMDYFLGGGDLASSAKKEMLLKNMPLIIGNSGLC